MKSLIVLSLLVLMSGPCLADDKVLSLGGNWFYPKFYVDGKRDIPIFFWNNKFHKHLASKEESNKHLETYRLLNFINMAATYSILISADTSDEVLERFPIALAINSGIAWFNHRNLSRAVDAYNQTGINMTYNLTGNRLSLQYKF